MNYPESPHDHGRPLAQQQASAERLGSARPAHTYSRGADVIRHAAEQWGITVSEEQSLEWQYLIASAYVLDNSLDNNARPIKEREQQYDDLLADLLAGRLAADGVTDAESLVGGWQDEKIERIRTAAQSIKEIARTKRQTMDAKGLGKLALFEGAETARFLSIEATDEPSQDFNRWLRDFLRLGVVVDSAVDLPEDYGNRLTLVQPTHRNQLIIAMYSVASGVRLAKTTPLRLYRELALAGCATVSDRRKDKARAQST